MSAVTRVWSVLAAIALAAVTLLAIWVTAPVQSAPHPAPSIGATP